MVLLIGIAAAVAGAMLAWWLTRLTAARQFAEQRATLAADVAATRTKVESLTSQIERDRQNLGAMREAFQSLAGDALHTNRAAFLDSLESRHKAFDGLVQPIADTLKKVDTRLADAEKERIAAYAALTEKVAALGSTDRKSTRLNSSH